jgi:hypothetical protein
VLAGFTTATVQSEFGPMTNCTLVFRRSASARASCSPLEIESAVLRILVFCIHAV